MSLLTRFQNRIAQWSVRRHGVDVPPLTLRSRRIYILPTRLGLLYAVAVIAMGLGGMNYSNNLALLLAFLLAAIGLVAMHHCQRNLVGLRLHTPVNASVHAGHAAYLQLNVEHAHTHAHLQLLLEARWQDLYLTSTITHVDAGNVASLAFTIPSQQRGWLTLARYELSTRYPLGLFRAWVVLHMPLRCLIYPKPEASGNTPPATSVDSQATANANHHADEFIGFRRWQPGDPPQHIAWKQYARGAELLVAQHRGSSLPTLVFDWQATQGLPFEARLARLTRWVLDAHQQGLAFGLTLPGFYAAPERGASQLQRCLTALALFNGPAA